MQKTNIERIYYGSTPDLVWKEIFREQGTKIAKLMAFTGRMLFGINNTLTQQLIDAIKIPSCSLNDWNNDVLIEEIFSYHLKRRTNSYINWRDFLNKWWKQGTIIELHSNLKQLYPTNYQLNERELNAWRTMLYHIGCHNITPFLRQESEIRNKYHLFKNKKIYILIS